MTEDIRPKVLSNMLTVACFYKESDPTLSQQLTEYAFMLARDICDSMDTWVSEPTLGRSSSVPALGSTHD